MDEDLARIVRELKDRQDIRDALVRYCRGVDRLDREMLLSAYHPGAIDDHGVFVGDREAFADWAFGYHARAQHATQHIITNHYCELDGDVAHTETYWLFAGMNTDGSPLSIGGGRYIDRFEKRDGRWAIAERKCLGDWGGVPGPSPLPEAAYEALNSGGPPSRDRNDPSYQRPLTIDRTRVGYVFPM